MLSSPFPSFVAFSFVEPDGLADFELYAEEAAALSPQAVAKRQRHFRMGRAAAHRALCALGVADQPIPRAEDGRPLWPPGVVGAITHTEEIAAAAVARRESCAGIGIDLEALSRQVSREVARRVCSDAELHWVEERDSNQRSLMIFAAKETIFKALYPLERVFLGFGDAELCWHEPEQTFVATIAKQASPERPIGYELRVGCRIVNDLVFAYTHLPEEP